LRPKLLHKNDSRKITPNTWEDIYFPARTVRNFRVKVTETAGDNRFRWNLQAYFSTNPVGQSPGLIF
jgi:hypothetical protein